MRRFVMLCAAPLGLTVAQPAQPAARPPQEIVALDAHVARHAKSKAAPTAKVKKSEVTAASVKPATPAVPAVSAVKKLTTKH